MLELPDWIFWTMLAFPIIFALLFFLSVYAVGFSTIKAFLKAKRHKSTILFVFRKDKRIDLMSGSYGEGMIDVPGGEVLVRPDAKYILPNGLPAGIVFEQYAVTLTPEVITAAENLRALGFNSAYELELYKNIKQRIEAGEEVSEREKEFVKAVDERIKDKKLFFTAAVHAIENFLTEINPAMIKARIERRVAKEMEGMRRTDWAKIVMLISILMIVGAIALYIVQMAFSSQQTPGWVSSIIQAIEGSKAKVISQNATAAASTPIGLG